MNLLKRLYLPLSLILFLGSSQLKAGAIPGTLDLSFGNDETPGYFIDDNSKIYYSVAITSDGNIIVAGSHIQIQTFSNLNGDIIALYSSNKKLKDFSSITNGLSFKSIKIYTANQKEYVVAVGGMISSKNEVHSLIACYNVNGTLDTSFGNNSGYFYDSESNYYDDVAIMSGMNIVVAGKGLDRKYTNNDGNALYYNNGYIVKYNFTGTKGDDAVFSDVKDKSVIWNSVAIKSNNNIVVVGNYGSNGLVAQYKPDETLDQNFNAEKILGYVIDQNSFTYNSVTIQTINGIEYLVVAGQSSGTNKYGYIARYNSDGTLDASFNAGQTPGYVIDQNSFMYNSVTIQTINGVEYLVVAGQSSGTDKYGYIARYNSDGTFDRNFNAKKTPGYVIDQNSFMYNSVIVQTINGIEYLVVAGQSSGTDKYGYIARYIGGYPNTPMGFVEKYSGIDLGLLGGIAKVN